MKFKIFVSTLVFGLFFSCNSNSQNGRIKLADVQAFEKEIQTDVQLIDVRTPEEFASGHIANAVNMNINDADFEKKIETLDKNKKVLVYCKAGGRSARAAKILSKLGFENIVDLDGGVTQWNSEGKSLE